MLQILFLEVGGLALGKNKPIITYFYIEKYKKNQYAHRDINKII